MHEVSEDGLHGVTRVFARVESIEGHPDPKARVVRPYVSFTRGLYASDGYEITPPVPGVCEGVTFYPAMLKFFPELEGLIPITPDPEQPGSPEDPV